MMIMITKQVKTMKTIKKIPLLLLAFLMITAHFPYIPAFAEEYTDCRSAETNTKFAIKAAEIIRIEENPDSMLRIIGKCSKKPSDSVLAYAENCVFSQDGRFILQFTAEKDLSVCLDELNSNPDIIYAERDVPIYTEALEESAEYLSWGVEAIEADIYSESIIPAEGDSVTVAVVDSGCEDIDFIKDRLVQGYDFADNDSDAMQDDSSDSHGTFLASIITDCTRNLPINIMPVRVLGSKTGSLINAVNGIIYAVDNGADVINLSLGAILNNCRSLEDAIKYAEDNNVTVIVCAGNTKSDIKNFCPAHVEDVITVSSINSEYGFSHSFSNFGDGIDLAAPGENIIGYNASGEKTVLSGTSMSTAFVSAAAAMFLLDNPACNNHQVRDALKSCAEDYGDTGLDKYYGWGVLKLSDLLNSDKKYVESVSFSQKSYEFFVGETLKIEPVFSPSDATDKNYILTVLGNNISIDGNIITAVSAGISTVTVTSNDGAYSDTVQITVKNKPVVPPEITAVLKIKNNPVIKTINYGESLRLTAEVTNSPDNSAIWWYVDGKKCGEGKTFEVFPTSDKVYVTAKLVDSYGNAVLNSQGVEISDSETVEVNSGFFQKIISFFKNLFRMNRTVVQFIIEN